MKMRRFVLQRDKDVTGLTGTGVVAWGCEFPNGKVAMTWERGHVDASSATWFDSIEDLETIHGHGGNTRIVFADFAIDFDEIDRQFGESQAADERALRAYL